MVVIYHQSYALVTWMFRFRRTELARYLQFMLDEPPGVPTSRRHLEVFERAFGDSDALDAAWRRHERAERDRLGRLEIRRVLLNDQVLAALARSGRMRPESLARLRELADGDQVSEDGRDADGTAGASTSVMMSGVLED